ncbi:hypothetical protein Vadar_017382 [Vaccinium darrowii]|uniref:Uncharacterized protein n=1 Tax=Vaccinium darrowii TaxID=229202 RepID=A0ACB7YML9_9ERIC|nr:hypothetical protein Vadar_017382 [Vaccinium darrowii]
MLRTDLGILSYITAVGLFSILVVVVCVICVGAENGGVGFHGNGKALLAIGGVPTSVSLYMLCFGGHSLIPTLYASMQNKGHFTKAMAVSFSFVTLVYLSIGLVGYLMYGSEVNPQITLNLPTTNVGSKIAIYATLVIPITKYALVITPVANALQIGPFLHKGRLLRIILLFSTAVIACLFPRFEIIMAVLGSIFVVLGSVVIPCCCYLKISGVSQKRRYEYWGIIVLIVLTSLTGAIGTYSSIVQLAQDM